MQDAEKGEVTVGSVWDQYMDIYVLQGYKEGYKEGIEEGRIKATVSIIESCAQKNHVSIEEACKMFDLTYQEYLDFKAELKAIEEKEAKEAAN